MIRILVVDDHPVVRDGVSSMLAAVDDFEVVGDADSGPPPSSGSPPSTPTSWCWTCGCRAVEGSTRSGS